MGCSGTCETRRYRFYEAFDDSKNALTKIDASNGAKPLASHEFGRILADYFESILVQDCKKCADGCECVLEYPRLESCTRYVDRVLPEPIVVTSGSDTYTISGQVRLSALFLRGVCTTPDPNAKKDTPSKPADRDFTLKTKKFKPKAGTATCNCHCERQVYEFRGTDATKVTPQGKAPPIDPNELSSWKAMQLEEAFGRDYSDTELEKCNAGCDCLTLMVPDTQGVWRVVKIATPKNIKDLTKTPAATYLFDGEYEVRPVIYKGVCAPKELSLETG